MACFCDLIEIHQMAYEGLHKHFHRPKDVDNMATIMAKDKLKTTAYKGEQQQWDVERYIDVHISQHSIMEGLVKHGYTGIDPRTKVCFLLDGIKTDKYDWSKLGSCRMLDFETILMHVFHCMLTLSNRR